MSDTTNNLHPPQEADTSLIIFKAISNFVRELGAMFGKRQRSLALYCRLIEKTSIVHEKPITKHINSFRVFCFKNRNALQEMKPALLEDSKITYSENVYINMQQIFGMSDKETSDVIWRHLLTISALVDPTSNAKKILKDKMEKSKSQGGTGKEEEFLSSVIEKVEKCVDPNSAAATDPMQAVGSIMSSGVFTDLIGNMQSGIQSGNLDIGKLMGVVQGMLGSLGNGDESGSGGADMSGMMNMIKSMSGQAQAKLDEKK